ncbi:MAG TPA: ATP synthase F1 subunit epsilon [Candidatus Limnocylindrales bacterium]|nr:ATP synthase F1 subunit epsilon [Candidatus Limnocylindrales bacterium]
MKLRIVTPAAAIVDAEVSEVTAPGTEGEFGVLPLHVTFLGALAPGLLTYVEGGTRKRVVVDGGYAEVRDDVITILADSAELPSQIDAASARADVTRLEQAAAAGADDPARIEQILRDLSVARARLAAATA